MRGLTHSTLNAAAWLTIITIGQTMTNRPLVIPVVVGTTLVVAVSRLPDVDHANSGPGHRINRLLPDVPKWLEQTFGIRRSPFHWGGVAIGAGLLISVLAALIAPPLWWTGTAIGGSWLLHIVGDCLTWQGAPLLAPVSFRMIRPRYGRRFQCGGRFERRIILPGVSIWCGLMAVLVAGNLYQAFLATIS